MVKAKAMDTAKELEAQAKELFERMKGLQGDLSETLGAVRSAEGMLAEKEKTEAKARAEREKADRLRDILASDENLAFHVGEEPEAVEAAVIEETRVQEPAHEAAKADAPQDVAPKSEEPSPKPAEEKEERSAARPAETSPVSPVQNRAPQTSEQRPQDNGAQPRQGTPTGQDNRFQPTQGTPAGQDNRFQPTQGTPAGQDNRFQPRQGTPAGQDNRFQPRQGTPAGQGYQPRQGAPAGQGYQPRQGAPAGQGYQPRQGAPAGQGYQPRQGAPAGQGYQPRQGTTGQGYQPRQGTTGQGYQPRQGTTGQGYQPRQGTPGQGYQPRQGTTGQGYQPRQGTAAGQDKPKTGYQAHPAARTVVEPLMTKEQRDRRAAGPSSSPKSREEERKAKSRKTLIKEESLGLDDDSLAGRRRKKKQQPPHRPEPVIIEKAVLTVENTTVKELSEKIGKPAAEIIKKLFILGIMATINQEIDFDTCSLIAADYNIELELNVAKTAEDVLQESIDEVDEKENLVLRPPVVTIMGHVDHGKTSLLDAIRQSSITEGEAGGITQHIGAYTVTCHDRLITFIDTPGHEAFTSMRARGAQVTDIVILVVAADDGIMPQTVEAINHAKAAGVPIIVAINKIDRETANPDRVKQQLTEHGLVSEEWGGETICVPVSAKTKVNLDTLLEMILLQADVLELKANPSRSAKGTIIEAELDKGRGPVATVLVQNGTLKIGDPIVAGTTYGRVRAMMDDKGRRVTEVGPSQPVEVLGFSEVPAAGDTMNVAEIDKLSRQVAEERRDKQKAEQLKNLTKISLDDLFSQIEAGNVKDLNVIVKADVQGSVEAVRQALEKLSNGEVRVRCIHGGVGAITGSDIMFASASNAIVIGFNVRPDNMAREMAEREKVDVRMYRIIYKAIEDIEKAMKGMFAPVFKEIELGHAEVRSTFKVTGVGTIAGSYVQEGKVSRNAQVRVVRGGIVIHEGKIASLKRFKDDAKEVAAGYECGIGIENFNDLREGDVIEAFVMEEVER